MVASQEAISVGRWTGDFIMPACVISQPRFFPGLHYLHRMMVTDVFVVLDTVQFTPGTRKTGASSKVPPDRRGLRSRWRHRAGNNPLVKFPPTTSHACQRSWSARP